MAWWTASAVVAYYTKQYGLDKGILWSFMTNLFGIKRGDNARIDPADQVEFAAVVADYAANRNGATA